MSQVDRQPVLILVGECEIRLWGLGARERQFRIFQRAGVTQEITVDAALEPGDTVVLIRTAFVLQEDLVAALVAKPSVLLYRPAPSGAGYEAVAARVPADRAAEAQAFLEAESFVSLSDVPKDLLAEQPEELGPSYSGKLKKRQKPFCFSLETEPLAEIEKETFKAVYKGATDFVTKYAWPWPARLVTRWAAERHITPNSVTTLSLVFVILTFWCFWEGFFLAGILSGWFMTFLDTVDGKLARVTLTSSRWGDVYDHGIDLIHPPFWYWAWWHGVSQSATPGAQTWLDISLVVILFGYVAGRVLELAFIRGFGFTAHIWRPVDYFMRSITARRNPNLFLLMVFTLAGLPVVGFYAVALWTLACLGFHSLQLFQARAAKRQGQPVQSWLMSQP